MVAAHTAAPLWAIARAATSPLLAAEHLHLREAGVTSSVHPLRQHKRANHSFEGRHRTENDLLFLRHAIAMSDRARRTRDALFDPRRWPETQRQLVRRRPASSFIGGMSVHPTFQCPVETTLAGGTARALEQGRLLCGFQALLASSRACTVFSFGSNFDWSFEASIQEHARAAGRLCDIDVFDPTLTPPERVSRFRTTLANHSITLHELALAHGEEGSITFKTTPTSPNRTYPATSLRKLATTRPCVDVLKMDVEGAEFAALGFAAGSQGARAPPAWCAGMLLFELHPDKIAMGTSFTTGHLLDFVRWLETAGVHMYHNEFISFAQKYDGRMEMAFVNVTWLYRVLKDF